MIDGYLPQILRKEWDVLTEALNSSYKFSAKWYSALGSQWVTQLDFILPKPVEPIALKERSFSVIRKFLGLDNETEKIPGLRGLLNLYDIKSGLEKIQIGENPSYIVFSSGHLQNSISFLAEKYRSKDAGLHDMGSVGRVKGGCRVALHAEHGGFKALAELIAHEGIEGRCNNGDIILYVPKKDRYEIRVAPFIKSKAKSFDNAFFKLAIVADSLIDLDAMIKSGDLLAW